MADESKIRQRIELEGEKEYSAALKEAQRNLKTLRSELKAETAELGNNASAQQKNEVKVRNLQKQIAEQEKVVRTYEKALKEVREKYGENADAVAKYEQKLNEARASLANMKNGLEDVDDEMKNLKNDSEMAVVAAKSVSDTIGNLASIGDTVADSISGIFTGMLDTIEQAVGQVWQLIAETARKANNWTDLANAYGTTPQAIQEISSALEWAGGSFDDLMTIIQKVNWSGSKKEGVLKNLLGVSDTNFTNKLDYTMLVLDELYKLKSTNPKGFDSIIEDFFGDKQETKVSWFLDNWKTIQEKREEYKEGKYGLNEDELSTMNDVWVELQSIEGKWNDLKRQFAAGFGTITLDIMTNVNGALDALSKYFNAETDEEREEALKQLEKNITDTFDTVKTAIETGLKKLEELAEQLKESDNPTVQAIGNIMGGLVDVLKWFTEDNMQNVVSALEILAAFWVGAKAFGMIGKVTELASQLALIKSAGGLSSLTSLFSGGAGAAGAAGVAALTGSDVTAAVVAASGPLATAIAGITMSVGLVALAVPVVSALIDIIKGQWPSWLPNPNKTSGEIALPDADKETQERATKVLSNVDLGKTFTNGKNALHAIFGDNQNGGNQSTTTTEEDNAPKVNYTAPVYVPSPRANAKFNITEEQKAAAEAFWDVWKSGKYSDEEYDSAYETLERTFSGNEATFDNLMTWLEKLYDAMSENEGSTEYSPETWENIPASWWMKNGGEESASLKSIPGQMRAAVQSGMSNIKVVMDGQTVGNLVAPYVSEQIARDMA